jgi:hypothetical protein
MSLTISQHSVPVPLGPLSLRVLKSASPHSLVIITVPPHTPAFPLLSNPSNAMTFHVLKGTMKFGTSPSINTPLSSATSLEAIAGSTISVPPGAIHGFGNASDVDAELLCVFSPGEWVGCLQELTSLQSPWLGEEFNMVLKGWGCALVERQGNGDEDSDEGEDEELMFQPGLRCMA